MTKFTYKPRGVESLTKRAEQRATQFDSPYREGVKLFKPVEGENAIRILPPTWDDAFHYGLDVYFHYSVGEEQQTYICPLKMNVGECPICLEAKTIKPKNKADEDLLKAMKPGKRVLVWVIDRNKEEDGPLLYPMPWTMDKDISAMSIDPRSGEILHVDDPENGFDIFFTKTGTGITTKYTGTRIDRRESPLHSNTAVANEWLEAVQAMPITEAFVVYDTATIEASFSGKPKAPAAATTATTRKRMIDDTTEHEAEAEILRTRVGGTAKMTRLTDVSEDTDTTEVEPDATEVTGRTKLASALSTSRIGRKS